MNTCPRQPLSPLKDHFSWYEKLIARACLAGVVLTAGAGIYRENRTVAIGYAVFVALGALLVVYDSLCVYCPYPFRYSDCLFYPYQLVERFAKLRAGKIHWARQSITILVFGGMFATPQYWLWGNWGLLATFWGLTLPLALLLPLRLCRRCRNGRCLGNRAVGLQHGPDVQHDP
jgi:hypothetical protein